MYHGHYELFGSIIRKAIDDYKILTWKRKHGISLKRDEKAIYEEVKTYLFSESGLEGYLQENGFDELVSISSIRNEAEKGDVHGLLEYANGVL